MCIFHLDKSEVFLSWNYRNKCYKKYQQSTPLRKVFIGSIRNMFRGAVINKDRMNTYKMIYGPYYFGCDKR